MHIRILNSFLTLLFLLAVLSLPAQKPLSSPYSRYGIGEVFRMTNSQTMSLGGAGTGIRSNLYVNFQNPASYTAFDSLSFVFDGGVTSNFQKLKTDALDQSASFTTLKNLTFGFPVTRWWRTSIGLLPYSQVGYKVADDAWMEDIGNVSMVFQGEGGYNQLYLGHGIGLSRNLSVGVNVSYLFGTITRIRSVKFPDSLFYRNFRVTDDISLNDFVLTYGMQYHTLLPNKVRFAAGMTYTASTKAGAKKSMIAESFTEGTTGLVTVKDTIDLQPGIKGTIILPQAYGLGFSFEKQDRWLVAADLKMQDWSSFRIFGEQDSLKNSMEAGIGFQFIPNNNSLSSYLQKVSYRVGVRYAQTYLQLRSNQLTEMGFSFGMGLPLLKSRSRVNIGVEIGRRGTTADNLIQENFVLFSLGVSVFENWFYRKKFE